MAQPLEPNLKIGIIQRFGEEETDQLTLTGVNGTPLTLTFMGGDGKPKVLQTPEVTLEAAQVPLTASRLSEVLVLGDYGTFETAEAQARFLKNKGIEVEVTQPGRWQVWAKREVYSTPLLRRLLQRSLLDQGITQGYLEGSLQNTQTVTSFIVGAYRYNRRELEITSPNDLFRVREGDEKQPNTLYSGQLRIQPNAYGNYTLVNEVPLETYLRGVVPHEIGPGAPYQAVRAQTILARTYSLRNLRRFVADNYELCATVHCQVYRGLTGTVATADQAIAATTGLVLTHNNELIDALYSSSTGGVTANFEDIWDGKSRPYLKPRLDSVSNLWNLTEKPLNNEENFKGFISLENGFNETGRRLFRWQGYRDLEQLQEHLNRYLERIKHPLVNFEQIQGMEITERSLSGRVLKLVVTTEKGKIELRKNETRSAFGPPRSTLFRLEPVYETQEQQEVLKGYQFIGGGFGHGVGLSQFGSYNLANLGWSGEQILEFYFPGTTLEPLTENTIFFTE